MRRKKGKKGAKFANLIVTIVVLVELVITAVVLYTYVKNDTVVPASVITAFSAFWGGELLILALRQIFGSDVIKQAKNDHDDYTSI